MPCGMRSYPVEWVGGGCCLGASTTPWAVELGMVESLSGEGLGALHPAMMAGCKLVALSPWTKLTIPLLKIGRTAQR